MESDDKLVNQIGNRDWNGVEYAGLGPRLGAWAIDLLILSVSPFFLFGGILLSGGTMANSEGGARIELLLLEIALVGFYVVGFWSWKQATPGKMLKGLLILDANTGAPVSIGRYFVRLVFWYIFGLLLLGFIWIAFNPRKQGWHDLIAGTVVVKKNTL